MLMVGGETKGVQKTFPSNEGRCVRSRKDRVMCLLRLRIGTVALCAALAFPVLSVVSTVPAAAQSTASGAVVTGPVFDPRGVPLPGAAVAVHSEATGATVKVVADGAGKYSVSG